MVVVAAVAAVAAVAVVVVLLLDVVLLDAAELGSGFRGATPEPHALLTSTTRSPPLTPPPPPPLRGAGWSASPATATDGARLMIRTLGGAA
jgi:hypothetical protein